MLVKLKNLLIVVAALFFLLPAFAQTNQQKELEQKRQRLLEEIKTINQLLFKEKKQKRSVLEHVEDINKKISVRRQLISVTNQQANLLNRQINSNLKAIRNLTEELVVLKEDYAEMIRKSYKNKSTQSRLMFILSSKNFFQAYKRLQYLKQYTNYRKEQANSIQQKTEKLKQLNNELIAQRKEKERLIAENKKEQALLEQERKAQRELLQTIQKNESKYATQIRKKQREAAAIEKQINEIIKAAIAKSNKSSGNTRSTNFALTPETKLVNAGFEANKGKLPSPVEKGIVVMRFGRQPHPIVKSVTIQSNGLRIATEKDADARAVYDGEVLAVLVVKGGNKVVLIQHGNYITAYNNLSRVYVKEGDKVKTKQPVGKVFTNPTTGDTILKFSMYQNSKVVNPSNWIYRM